MASWIKFQENDFAAQASQQIPLLAVHANVRLCTMVRLCHYIPAWTSSLSEIAHCRQIHVICSSQKSTNKYFNNSLSVEIGIFKIFYVVKLMTEDKLLRRF